MVARLKFEGREYKLLLKPKAFRGDEESKVADAFWAERIAPTVKEHLGTSVRKVRFDTRPVQRIVRYWDTGDSLLALQDLTLRERVPADMTEATAKGREITLKLRSPDLFLAAASNLKGKGIKPKTKFEEDIAPFQVAGDDGTVTLADPLSTRSRFSRSTKLTVHDEDPCSTLAKVFACYPTLPGLLEAGGVTRLSEDTPLRAAWSIEETVYSTKDVELSDGLKAEFDITLWRFPKDAPRRRVAELSYNYEPNGADEPAAARAALKLFLGLQDCLGELIDPTATSKTALALKRTVGPGMQHV